MIDHSLLSNALGYLSILCWLGAQFPQVIVNIRTKSVEGLALPFLANWLFGDITNLVGCILTQQLPFQTYLATYFVFVDLSLVAQYIYYYKPPPSAPSVSPSPSLTPTLTLTPTGVIYSPRTLTRPHSRTPLLVSEVEQGHKPYDSRARSHSRVGSSRFSGVTAAYPPAGLLPSTDELVHVKDTAGGTTVLVRRGGSRPSLKNLKRPGEGSSSLAKDSEKGKEKAVSTSKDRPRKEHSEHGEEESDEVGNMTESFYSDISFAPLTVATKRRVSWSQDTPSAPPPPRLQLPSSSEPPIGEQSQPGSGTTTIGENTPRQNSSVMMNEEEIRRRSRSRGRPSTRHRPFPSLTYSGSDVPVSPTSDNETPANRPSLDATAPETTALLHETIERERMKDGRSSSKSGSRKRSASIVFLSFGIWALFAFGRAPSNSNEPVDRKEVDGRGRVLGWSGEVEDSPRISSIPSLQWDSSNHPSMTTPSFSSEREHTTLYFTIDSRRRRPHDPPPLTPEQKRRIIGRISAWACTTLYLTSRLPQIWKNYTRKSVQGLSLALFVFAFLGNTFYVASILSSPHIWEDQPESEPIDATLLTTTSTTVLSSILTRIAGFFRFFFPRNSFDSTPPPWKSPHAQAFLKESLPYLLGSGGTLMFDVIIVTQGIIYGRREMEIDEDEETDEEDDEDEDEEEQLQDSVNGTDEGAATGKPATAAVASGLDGEHLTTTTATRREDG
ncbi:PQ-loop-domain-containing protein [Serendipita vermifera]|nr:PQ-loop-domain-containing protein [Serendipita vermifera]